VTAKGQNPVKAIVQDRFGPPGVLRLSDTGLPEAGPGDVLIRVHAAALNPADWHILRGDPLVARLMGVGLTRPKARVAGIDAAGVVEAAGANVRGLASGDDVLGFFRGAFAEYACAAADLVVPKPSGLTFEQAAAVPIAATTALRGIRDVGEVTAGQRVLVNGAGGGVGSYAAHSSAADRTVSARIVILPGRRVPDASAETSETGSCPRIARERPVMPRTGCCPDRWSLQLSRAGRSVETLADCQHDDLEIGSRLYGQVPSCRRRTPVQEPRRLALPELGAA
jgi:Alcohol dehydrogenase GroES-like domain